MGLAPAPVEIRLLGPFEVRDGDGPIELPGGKPRALLALLALEAGRVVSVDRLVDGLWGESPPSTAPKVVLGYVSRLRKLLPSGLLETREPGYLLNVAGSRDLDRFEALRAEASSAAEEGRWRAAADLLREALELWRGPALADVADELGLPGELARFEEMRQAALEERIDADVALGREAAVVPELEALVQAYPLRERPRYLLMLVLYRLGRQSDALQLYRETRQLLVDELGIEPGADLQRLERQILVQDDTLAPARAVDRLPPLPVPLTPLVGRVKELHELGDLLGPSGPRLVTLVGPGGVGKTRLALAAAELRREAVLVRLATIAEPDLVGSVVAGVLGVRDETQLPDWLRARELLLVLDNFEHVLDAAPLVTELLSAAPGLRVLATSREPLNVSGERTYPVSPLPASDAVDLFVERAAAAGADVSRTGEVEEICQRLDFLPLAMELAAARTRVLGPSDLLARIEQRLPFLTGGPRDLPERQRTLRATIEWSHALLDPSEQRVFARLGVFAGGCTVALAEDVCDITLEAIESLVDKSLVQHDAGRFSMLETIREFAMDRLEESGEAAATLRRLAERMRVEAESFADGRNRGEKMPLEPLESELDNIRESIRGALQLTDDSLAVRLVAPLYWYWNASERLTEGLRWTLEALDRAGEIPDPDRAGALRAAAQLATLTADYERATALGDEAQSFYRKSGDLPAVAEVLRWLAHANIRSGNVERARELHAESIDLAEQVGSPIQQARSLRVAGEDELDFGEIARADELLLRSLELARSARAANDTAMTLHSLGDVALVSNDAVQAGAWFVEALTVTDDGRMVAYCLGGLSAAAALDGRQELAGLLWGAVQSHERQAGEAVIETVDRYLSVFQAFAGEAFDDATERGRELTLEEARAEAIAAFGPPRG
jgi:predicted ATPase/DNA-binding SARP family transcriptional activator